MKNCPKCGAELRDDAAFCSECGEPLGAGEAAPETPKADPLATAKKTPISLILGIVSVACLFVPGLNSFCPVTAVIGIGFGIKESKEGGSKGGLVLSILALAFAIISFALALLVYFGPLLFGMAVGFFGILEENFSEFGVYL